MAERFNVLEYIEDLMEQGMSNEDASRCAAMMLADLYPDKYDYDCEDYL